MSESLRRRIPFVNTEEGEDVRILDEQEQDEIIQQLKEKSSKSSAQYALLLHVVIALSCLLHVIYLNKDPRVSPFENMFPSQGYTDSVPLAYLFTLLHLLAHFLLDVRFSDPSNAIRAFLGANFPTLLSHCYRVIFSVCSIAPVLSLFRGGNWQEVAWWFVTDVLAFSIYSAQKWNREEAERIEQLEKLRYTAKGA